MDELSLGPVTVVLVGGPKDGQLWQVPADRLRSPLRVALEMDPFRGEYLTHELSCAIACYCPTGSVSDAGHHRFTWESR